MSDTYQTREKQLLGILAEVGPFHQPDATAEVQMYLDAGEYGLALETLCAALEREQRPVLVATYLNISELGTHMGVDPDYWLDLVIRTPGNDE